MTSQEQRNLWRMAADVAQGDVDAMLVCLRAIEELPSGEATEVFSVLDEHGLRGARIATLFDVADRDVRTMVEVVRDLCDEEDIIARAVEENDAGDLEWAAGR